MEAQNSFRSCRKFTADNSQFGAIGAPAPPDLSIDKYWRPPHLQSFNEAQPDDYEPGMAVTFRFRLLLFPPPITKSRRNYTQSRDMFLAVS